MGIDVKARPQVSDDMRKLGSNSLRWEAIREMVALRTDPFRGDALGIHAMTGDLSGCRKLYFDQARHRIVYRLLPDELNPREADVIVVGPREAMEVYIEAVRRLGR